MEACTVDVTFLIPDSRGETAPAIEQVRLDFRRDRYVIRNAPSSEEALTARGWHSTLPHYFAGAVTKMWRLAAIARYSPALRKLVSP